MEHPRRLPGPLAPTPPHHHHHRHHRRHHNRRARTLTAVALSSTLAVFALAAVTHAQRRPLPASLRAAPSVPAPPPAVSSAAPEPSDTPDPAPSALRSTPTPALDPPSLGLLTPPALADTPVWARLLARPVVERALRLALQHANLSESPGRSLATRARASAWMPQLSVRVTRGLGLSAVSLQQGFASTDRSSSDDSFAVDARLTLDLGRAVFAPEEPQLQRDEEHRSERRRQLEREVLDLLSALARALATAHLNGHTPGPVQSLEVALLRARLEALTHCSLSALLASNTLTEESIP